jgi:hypothetical protein
MSFLFLVVLCHSVPRCTYRARPTLQVSSSESNKSLRLPLALTLVLRSTSHRKFPLNH